MSVVCRCFLGVHTLLTYQIVYVYMFDTGNVSKQKAKVDLQKKERAIEKFETVTGNSIESLFKSWHYEKDLYERVLDKDEKTSSIGKDYQDELENVRIACRKLSDDRNSRLYMINLITGWIIEDIVVVILQDVGFNAKLNGDDADRRFLKNPTKEPDIEIDGSTKLELKSDNTGYCKNTGYYDFKKKSYKLLKEDELVLLRLVESEEYFVFTKESCTILGEGKAYGEPSKKVEVSSGETVDLVNLKSELNKYV